MHKTLMTIGMILSLPTVCWAVDSRWTSGWSQGTSEAIVHTNDGSSLNIYCAEGGDGNAGVILAVPGVNLKGQHLLQVVVDGKNLPIELTDGQLVGGWRNGDNAIYMLVDSLVKTRSTMFKAEIPDLNFTKDFSALNARSALAPPIKGQKQQTIITACMK
jgi:hypothetical protein